MGDVVVEVSQRGAVSRGGAEPRRAVRTLPVRVKPLSEESLDSWLEALAARTDATWGQILRAVGIFGMQGNAASYWAARANVSLTPGQVDTISYCTGVEPSSASGDDFATVDQRLQLATSFGGLTARQRFAVLSEVSGRAQWQVAGVVAVAVRIRMPDAWMLARRRVPRVRRLAAHRTASLQ